MEYILNTQFQHPIELIVITNRSEFAFQVCTNINRCYCDIGFAGPDCAIVVPITTPAPTEPAPTADNTIKMEKKETPYGKRFRGQYAGPSQLFSDNF